MRMPPRPEDMPQPSDKAKALSRWARVAKRDLDPATIEWLVQVAQELITAGNVKNANDRRMAVLKAVGLVGKASTGAHAARVAVALADAGPDDGKVARRRVLVGYAVRHPEGSQAELTPEAMRKRIERARKKNT